jgi:hypothetical protein
MKVSVSGNKGKVAYKSSSKMIKLFSTGKMAIQNGTPRGMYYITVTAKTMKSNKEVNNKDYVTKQLRS